MTPDEVRRMSADEVLIFARGQRPIRAPLLQYHKQPYFKRLAAISRPAVATAPLPRRPPRRAGKRSRRWQHLWQARSRRSRNPVASQASEPEQNVGAEGQVSEFRGGQRSGEAGNREEE